MRNEGSDVFRFNFMQAQARYLRVSLHVGGAVLIEPNRIRLRDFRGANEWEKVLIDELLKRGGWLLLSNAHLTLCKRGLMGGFDLPDESINRRASRSSILTVVPG